MDRPREEARSGSERFQAAVERPLRRHKGRMRRHKRQPPVHISVNDLVDIALKTE